MGKGLRLEVQPPSILRRVMVDRVRLRQVLFNLLGNAIKFTTHGQVRLAVTDYAVSPSTPESAMQVGLRFAVHDTGIGIENDQLTRIFDAFSQADETTTRTYGGTGLGLTISRQLVSLMGGTLCVRSTPGQGSEFWFDVALPLAPDGEACPQSDVGAVHSGPQPLALRILVVDDVPTNRVLVGKLLQRAGHDAVYANDGAQAVALVQAEPFDGVLMDMQMPVMDGVQAAAEIRAWERASAREPLPMVALTANAMPADQQRCLQAGMDDCLTKPIHRPTFDALLRQWQQRAQARQALKTQNDVG